MTTDPPPRTEDGHHVVIDGRRWRATDPEIPQARRAELQGLLMAWRREVRRTRGTPEERSARDGVQAAKVALGERGSPWWEQTPAERRARWEADVPGPGSGYRPAVTDTPIDLGRPVQGDVIELILADHRRFETLLRDLRDSTSDRDAVRRALAAVHTAHAIAEERHVYPKLRRKDAITEHEAEHGEEEHAEGHEAMLAVLELKGTDTAAFDDAVEELARVVNHHLTEEELTILNPAREKVGERVRADLGALFAQERNSQLDQGCGTVARIRDLIAEARREGVLDGEDENDDDEDG